MRSMVLSIADWSKVAPGVVSSSPYRALGIDVARKTFDVDLAEREQLPFVDPVGDVETGAIASKLGSRRYDSRIRVAVLHVVLPHQLPIQRPASRGRRRWCP